MRCIYVDTCVYLNYFKNEGGKYIHPGQEAIKLFNRILDGEFQLVVSDHLKYELYKHAERSTVDDFIYEFEKKGLLVTVKKTNEDVDLAKAISSHFQDPLHAILAKKAGAEILVTRNLKDFPLECVNMIDIMYPESVF